MINAIDVGFVGLGDMGAAIVQKIIDAGFSTTLWARRPNTLAPFCSKNVHHASSLAELGRASDIVGVCVFNDSDVRDVVLGDAGILHRMRAGGIILIHSTIFVDTVLEIKRLAASHNVAVLDAPVSGSRSRALDGTLTIMVGGDAVAYARAVPVMRAYGSTIRHMGGSGSGQIMKVLNNALGAANLGLASRAIDAGLSLGLNGDDVSTILRTSSGASFMLNLLVDRVLPAPDDARRVLSMLKKDVALYRAARLGAKLEPSLIDTVAEETIDMLARYSERTV